MIGKRYARVSRVLWGFLYFFVAASQVHANVTSIENHDVIKALSADTMDEKIYRDPWLTYEQLLTISLDKDGENAADYRWWLIRKAQSENLLYFYADFDKTLSVLEPLINDSLPHNIKARYFFFKGLSVQRQGNYQQARAYFELSMNEAKQIQFHRLYIRAKQELAYTYSLADLYDTSLKDLQEAFVEAFSLEDHYLIATINETYGAIYGYMNRYERSIEYYQKALNTYERLNYKAHIAEAIYGLASTYRYWGKYDQAIAMFKRYHDRVNYTPNTHISYFSAYGLGMSYAEKGDCIHALKYIDQAFKLDGLDDYDAELYKRKASCHIQLGQLEQAEKALVASEAIFAEMPELQGTAWQLENEKIKGHLAFALGHYQEAYLILEQYYKAYSQTLIDNSTSRVNNIRASLELERQEIEKALAAQRDKATSLAHENREQKSKQQSYFIVFLLTLLCIVIAVVTFQFKNNRRITALTRIDELSGLYNRRFCFESLERLLDKAQDNQGILTIIVFDIDDFKQINDEYGHPTGDKVINEMAKIAQDCSRPGDIIGRIGGEEFMCILPRADQEHGIKVAERIRKSFEQFSFISDDGQPLIITASFGVCASSSRFNDAKKLYHGADKAMYQAKRMGKNCIKECQ